MRKQQCWMAKGGAVVRVSGTDSSAEESEIKERSIRGSTTSRLQAMKGWTVGEPEVSADW